MIPVSPRFSGKLTTHLSRYSRILSTCFILGTITSQYARAAVTVNFEKISFLQLVLGLKPNTFQKIQRQRLVTQVLPAQVICVFIWEHSFINTLRPH